MDLKSLFQDISQAAEVLGHSATLRRVLYESWLDDPVKPIHSHLDQIGPALHVYDGIEVVDELWRILYLAALVVAGPSRTAAEVASVAPMRGARQSVTAVSAAGVAAINCADKMKDVMYKWKHSCALVEMRAPMRRGEPPLPMPPCPDQLSRPACEDLCRAYVAVYRAVERAAELIKVVCIAEPSAAAAGDHCDNTAEFMRTLLRRHMIEGTHGHGSGGFGEVFPLLDALHWRLGDAAAVRAVIGVP